MRILIYIYNPQPDTVGALLQQNVESGILIANSMTVVQIFLGVSQHASARPVGGSGW